MNKKNAVELTKKHALSVVINSILHDYSSITSAQTLEVIEVTSQKRTQSLQDVAVSVNAINQDKMISAGIDRLEDLSSYVPNLVMSETGTGTNVYIRGIGSGINAGFEQSAVLYVDGVYHGRAQLARAPFLDMQRAEVLRGPQPILFGKNSISGAISLETARPTDQIEGYVSTLYEPKHGEWENVAVLSGPLTARLSGRVAIRYQEIDGFFENSFLDRDEEDREEKRPEYH